MYNHEIFLCESEFTNPKAYIWTENLEMVVTDIYYDSDNYCNNSFDALLSFFLLTFFTFFIEL